MTPELLRRIGLLSIWLTQWDDITTTQVVRNGDSNTDSSIMYYATPWRSNEGGYDFFSVLKELHLEWRYEYRLPQNVATHIVINRHEHWIHFELAYHSTGVNISHQWVHPAGTAQLARDREGVYT